MLNKMAFEDEKCSQSYGQLEVSPNSSCRGVHPFETLRLGIYCDSSLSMDLCN